MAAEGTTRIGCSRYGLPGIQKKSWKMLVTKRRSPYSLEETGNFSTASVVRLACPGDSWSDGREVIVMLRSLRTAIGT